MSRYIFYKRKNSIVHECFHTAPNNVICKDITNDGQMTSYCSVKDYISLMSICWNKLHYFVFTLISSNRNHFVREGKKDAVTHFNLYFYIMKHTNTITYYVYGTQTHVTIVFSFAFFLFLLLLSFYDNYCWFHTICHFSSSYCYHCCCCWYVFKLQ